MKKQIFIKKTNLGFIIMLLFFVFSCNENKELKLNNRISELENQNQKLSDSISKLYYDNASNAQIIALTEKTEFPVNKESKLKFFINYPKNSLIYNINIYTEFNDGTKKMLFINHNENVFEYNFFPKKAGEHIIKLDADFKIKNNKNKEVAISKYFYLTAKKINTVGNMRI